MDAIGPRLKLVLAGSIFMLLAYSAIHLAQEEFRKFNQPPADYSEAHDVDVLMYGASWCGYCAQARKMLDARGMTYFEYDIELSKEGYRQHKELGGSGVPLFQIGGKVLKGYNPTKLVQLVAEKHEKRNTD